MISKPTKMILRMLVDHLREPHSRYTMALTRMERAELAMLETDLAALTADGPLPEDAPPHTPSARDVGPWEDLVYVQAPAGQPRVRRLYIGVGYLYQVEKPSEPRDRYSPASTIVTWHPPVFVPHASATEHDLEAIVAAARRVG